MKVFFLQIVTLKHCKSLPEPQPPRPVLGDGESQAGSGDVKVRVNKRTSAGLSDLGAQHGCHGSSRRSPLGMFLYIQPPHPSTLPLCLFSARSPLALTFCSAAKWWWRVGGWRGGGLGRPGEGEENGGEEGGGGGSAPPFFFFFCKHTQSSSSSHPPQPCYIIHSGAPAWGRWRWWRWLGFFWGGGWC